MTRHPDIDMARPVALRIAVCSRMVEDEPERGLPRHIVEAMRRRIRVEIEEAVRLHDEVFRLRPYKKGDHESRAVHR